MPLSFLSFLLHDICLYSNSHVAPRERDRTKVLLCVCVCVRVCARASVRVCVFWKGVRACVFLHNNGGKTFKFRRSKLKLEHFNFKGPQADKKAADL